MYDPDAPTGVGWWHQLVFNIPANIHTLPLNAGSAAANLLPIGSQQGYTDYGSSEYGGACPPFQVYVFKIQSDKQVKLGWCVRLF